MLSVACLNEAEETPERMSPNGVRHSVSFGLQKNHRGVSLSNGNPEPKLPLPTKTPTFR